MRKCDCTSSWRRHQCRAAAAAAPCPCGSFLRRCAGRTSRP
jgi:hypothetical protein